MTREQFIELVKAEQEALRRFLLTLCCGNADEADDLAQESLVKAYLSSADYKDKGKFHSWLYKIAYNTFISSRRQASQTTSLDELTDRPDTSLSPDRNYRYQHLYAALRELQPKERTALVLFYMDDRSTKEIAQIIDTTEAAVRQQLSRGRQHLKQKLQHHG
jgi:RNA polymerase sigma-70 factor (ECF subfamily)